MLRQLRLTQLTILLMYIVAYICCCKVSTSLAFATSKLPLAPINRVNRLHSSTHPQSSTISATVRTRKDRSESQQIIDTLFCPPEEERDRIKAGMQAFVTTSNQYRGDVIENNDPRTQYTYGEFPLNSFDMLVDRALELIPSSDVVKKRNVMVDVGSGCGRLVLYAALTRSTTEQSTNIWDFHGVEIGSQLHKLAVHSLQKGVDNELFAYVSESQDSGSEIKFHNGNALLVDDPFFPPQTNGDSSTNKSIQSLLSEVTLLFAYSTVWETDPCIQFDPDIQAMILSPKWSKTLAELCPNGCIAVTTDRALNPRDGWRLLDSMEVENPSVWGSVGYISVLEK